MVEKCKIVIFDNSDELSKGLKKFYETNNNMEVFDFDNINKGVEYVENNAVDIAVTDLVLKMPMDFI